MLWSVLADLVVVVHGLYIVFVVLGALLALRWRRILFVHLPAAVWGALVALADWPCPLTPLENALRRRAGEAGYPGSFVETWLLPAVYPGGMTREIQIGLGLGVVVVNVVLYALVWKRGRG